MRLRRHAVTFGLVGLSFGLSLYLFVVDQGAITTGEAEARQHNVFGAFRRAELSSIEIVQGDSSIRLVRGADNAGDGSYELETDRRSHATSPALEPADTGAVSKLLSELELAIRDRTLDPVSGDSELRALGLDAPRVRLTLSMGRLSYRLIVGGAAASPAGAAYARIEGEDRPFVIRRELVSQLQQPRDSYRNKSLVPYLASAIAEFEVRGAGSPRHLRRFDGQLRIETEHGWVRAERGAVERMIESLAELRAESFVSSSEAEQAISSGDQRLTLELTPGDSAQPKAVIEIGGPCPGQAGRRLAVRAKPEPRIDACVPEGVWEPLSVSADRLVDLHLFSLHPDETEQMVLHSGERRLELARLGTAWHMRAPTDSRVEVDTGNALAQRLTELVAAEIAPSSVAGSFSPRAEVMLTQVGGGVSVIDGKASGGAHEGTAIEAGGQARGQASDARALHRVEVGDRNGDGYTLVKRVDDGVFLKVRSDAARELFPSASAVRSRAVIQAKLAETRRVRIDADNVRQTLVRSSSGEWSLEEPKGFAVDPAVANEIAETLATLHAERWVADEDDGSYGWAAHRGRLELELAPQSPSPSPSPSSPQAGENAIAAGTTAPEGGAIVKPTVVTLGAPTAGGRFAKRDGVQGVFVLPASIEQTLATWAIDRSAFLLDLNGARELLLRRGRERFAFRLANDEAQRAAGQQAERLAAVREALSDLRAEAAVHTGAARKDEGFDKPRLELWLERPNESGRTGRAHGTIHLLIGAGDVWRGMNVYYARRDGVNATFVIAQSRIRPLMELR